MGILDRLKKSEDLQADSDSARPHGEAGETGRKRGRPRKNPEEGPQKGSGKAEKKGPVLTPTVMDSPSSGAPRPFLAQIPPRADPPALPLPPSRYDEHGVLRSAKGQFMPGTKAGPGLRGGLIPYAKSMTDDGRVLVDHAVGILSGWVRWMHPETGEVIIERTTVKEQSSAREFLADRGLLPRVHQVEVSTNKGEEHTLDTSKLTLEELRVLQALMQKAKGEPVDMGAAERVDAYETAAPNTSAKEGQEVTEKAE